ncbi:ribosomal protein S18 acetylase RimI-like enzyme [Williamsia limnetica]|uniref:Ribosomal protein S18 acetylase RimI-like enzyme n=1 Tax=Williamsia limnetica TaxID=882452 RepID=A0A318RRR2_WILLI|nr:GNAT family N-acetyltransferase [Williamsia limnetica]PYE19370.1 ribosomal protein S18 acetylase RimI-like enzyme [Williamsia limnetica]
MLIRQATRDDAHALAVVAAATFPLACPPQTTAAAKADFIATELSRERFDEYLADPERIIVVADDSDHLSGYTMIVFGEPADPDVAAAITLRPTVELSKCYVLPGAHGGGVAHQLMAQTLTLAQARGGAGVWLGVNELNVRAHRFYEKNGFGKVGGKRFLIGGVYEDDDILERALP